MYPEGTHGSDSADGAHETSVAHQTSHISDEIPAFSWMEELHFSPSAFPAIAGPGGRCPWPTDDTSPEAGDMQSARPTKRRRLDTPAAMHGRFSMLGGEMPSSLTAPLSLPHFVDPRLLSTPPELDFGAGLLSTSTNSSLSSEAVGAFNAPSTDKFGLDSEVLQEFLESPQVKEFLQEDHTAMEPLAGLGVSPLSLTAGPAEPSMAPAPVQPDLAGREHIAPSASAASVQVPAQAHRSPALHAAPGEAAAKRPANRVGQTRGWPQARKHHRAHCRQSTGCVDDCLLKTSFPEKWEEMGSKLVQVRGGGRRIQLWEHE